MHKRFGISNNRYWPRAACLFVVVVLAGAALPPPVLAEEGRLLGGYRFIPSSAVADPFIATHFRSATGLASTSNVDIPLLVLEGPPPDTLLSLEGNFLFVTAEADYAQVVHPKVLVRLGGVPGHRGLEPAGSRFYHKVLRQHLA